MLISVYICTRKTFFSSRYKLSEIDIFLVIPHFFLLPLSFLLHSFFIFWKKQMDKTLIDYDKNLEELERQREKLEIVMQMMGQEWEER